MGKFAVIGVLIPKYWYRILRAFEACFKASFSAISAEIVKGFSFVLIKWPLIHQKNKTREKRKKERGRRL
jgi:hypothetical protein